MKNSSNSITKKDKENSVQVKSGPKKNKLHTYLKLQIDDETGLAEIKTKDAKDQFFMGTHDIDLVNMTINRLTTICSRGEEINKDRLQIANATLAALQEIDPQDSIELMLASQMVTVNNLALEMSRRAALLEQTFDGVDANINRLTKLMRTYTAQMEALNKYRNKGKQQITVKHQSVQVNDGGQAIVGDIKRGGGNG